MVNKISDNHRVYNIAYHITWIPKYRKHILCDNIEESLKLYLFEKAKQLNIKIEAFEIMPDHIHLFIKSNPNLSITFIIQQLKGYTSFKLRKQFPFLKRIKSLWTHSYYVETIGIISEPTIKKYIEMQKSHIS